jgi:hypothetical protein
MWIHFGSETGQGKKNEGDHCGMQRALILLPSAVRLGVSGAWDLKSYT